MGEALFLLFSTWKRTVNRMVMVVGKFCGNMTVRTDSSNSKVSCISLQRNDLFAKKEETMVRILSRNFSTFEGFDHHGSCIFFLALMMRDLSPCMKMACLVFKAKFLQM